MPSSALGYRMPEIRLVWGFFFPFVRWRDRCNERSSECRGDHAIISISISEVRERRLLAHESCGPRESQGLSGAACTRHTVISPRLGDSSCECVLLRDGYGWEIVLKGGLSLQCCRYTNDEARIAVMRTYGARKVWDSGDGIAYSCSLSILCIIENWFPRNTGHNFTSLWRRQQDDSSRLELSSALIIRCMYILFIAFIYFYESTLVKSFSLTWRDFLSEYHTDKKILWSRYKQYTNCWTVKQRFLKFQWKSSQGLPSFSRAAPIYHDSSNI